ncbi:MAG TPA: hypothetical protein VNI84_06270, partial [Pyrinomonadaceae bacterium]|nr:hypothetical protein [Pyrinomonadaceae bacterium]
ADAPNLKLGENRALVYARAANILWKTDEKRARALFQNAVGELINAQTFAEADKKNAPFQNELLTGQSTRPQILNQIARRDAELALEYFFKTRPAAVVKALSTPRAAGSKISGSSSNYAYLAQNETNLEQSFIRLAADQNPERAAKLLNESLKKGLSNETFNLLKKLHEKDAESADRIASEIVGKLAQSGFGNDIQSGYQNTNVAVIFLNEFIREKPPTEKALKFDDAQMRNLAGKLFAFYSQQNDRNGYYNNYSILPIAEKLAPAVALKMKETQKSYSRRGGGIHHEYDPELGKLLNGEGATAEKLLGAAGKFPVNSRRQIYQSAAAKFVEQGDFNRATEVLTENFSDDALEEAMRGLNWNYTYSLINAGKFSEAERIIDEFPENTRVGALINLASAVYQKNPAENKPYAAAILGKARALISEKPEDSTEMSELMQIVSANALIEPTEAFRLLESIVPQVNELSEAAAVYTGFQRGSNIRQGEFLLINGNPTGFYLNDNSAWAKLAASDFDRATNLIDAFSLRESRVALKLQLAESIQH